MKLLLIKPNIGRLEHSLYVDEGRMEPLQLGVLAALTPDHVTVSLLDDRCEDIDYGVETDLVAITVETFTARRAYEISDEFRRRGRLVVLGGFHPTLLPQEASRHADAIVTGDAESVWGDVLADAAAGRLRPRYAAAPGSHACIQNQRLPRRDLFRGKGYVPVTLTQFGRGCLNACEFCAISTFFKRQHVSRAVTEVVREIQAQKRRLVFFVDDNLEADHDAAKALFRALIPLRIRWVSQGCIDMVHDRELMDLMVASGCLGHVIGFESIEAEALAGMQKTANIGHDFSGYEKELAILEEYGLQTWAAFTVGHDHDTVAGLYRLYDFALAHKFTFAAFNVLMPYPDTPFYQRLASEKRLLYDGHWWDHPEYRFNHAAFQPLQMTADELTSVAFDIRSRWSSPWVMLKRFLAPRTNLGSLYRMAVYWSYNPLFRREVFKKQGMRFGRQ